ncbi:hypothetical protein JOE49_003989 [Paenibacillus sp. PvR133]|uniref:hypothetical protein n=1 Tax=Paenibacillus sp. PvR133 TaxID=2806598 RepID=UPI001AE6A610|nr:hypothetical protein [Paenibacillus sp. PvR133]MBP1176737.1 hypothetical protein [Paenibacillus sp. PvR133]
MRKNKSIICKALTYLFILTFGVIMNNSKVDAAMDNNSVTSITESSASISGQFDTQYPGTYVTISLYGAFADGSTQKNIGQKFHSSYGQNWRVDVDGLKKNTTYTIYVTEYEDGTKARTPIIRKFATPEITNGPSIKLNWSNVGLTGDYSFELVRSNYTGSDTLYTGKGTSFTDTNPLYKNGYNYYFVIAKTSKGTSLMYSMAGYAGTDAVSNLREEEQETKLN